MILPLIPRFFQALSGMFSATFPVVFAYIADFVDSKDRASAYGLALATFGLSFTVGPITGGYLASAFGDQAVFRASFVLLLLNLLYMLFILPGEKVIVLCCVWCDIWCIIYIWNRRYGYMCD